MARMLSPVCLFLALAMIVAAFVIWSMGPPEVSVELHAARAGGDEAFEEVLESRLQRDIRQRQILIGALLLGSLAMTVMSFVTIRTT